MVSVNKGIPGATDTAIEQLWYTWSDRGIDSIRVGYRIRAASPSLSDPKSEHVRLLDRYQRYTLPSGADPTLPPPSAPVSLALIDTGTERILVHKVYTGRDGVGRYGTFFVHLLANLPPEFTPLDAISLWRSRFWRTFDDMGQPERSGIQLPALSLDDVRKQEQDGRPTGKQFDAQIKKFLPYVIEAYLTKNLLVEKRGAPKQGEQQVRPKLYIAAQDDLLADMISGLLHTLPPQLTSDLTFSTYQNDVSEGITEIVGTGWPSDPAQAQNPARMQLLPAQYFQDRLALNCYTGDCTELKNNPLVEPHPLVARFTQDATSYFLGAMSTRSKFGRFLALAKKYPRLTISEALALYDRIVPPRKVTQKDVEDALSPRYPVEYEISAEHLSDPEYQEKLIELVLTIPGWWQKWRANVINLYNHGTEYPLLREALAAISTTYAQPIVVKTIQQAVAQLAQGTRREGGDPVIEARIALFVDVMACMTPPNDRPDIWYGLLKELRAIQSIALFIDPYWSAYADLLKIWDSALPLDQQGIDLIKPLLMIPWKRFANFLALSLRHQDWVVFVTDQLGYKAPQPGPEIINGLDHSQIKTLLENMAQDYQQWKTATGLFDVLAQGNYQGKIELFFLLLDSPMGEDENTTKALLTYARLTLPEQALFLAKYGPRYLLDSKMTNKIMEMFTELAQSDYQQEKMRVLFAWLGASNLWDWFAASPLLHIPLKEATNFSRVLQVARLNAPQGGEVLLQFGPTYIPRYLASPTLLSLFKNYAELGTPQRVTILSMWLDCKLSQQIMEYVLDVALLNLEERRSVLLQYGERYLALYPRSSVLLSYVQEFLQYLRQMEFAPFAAIFKTGGEPSAEERLLASISRLPKSALSDSGYSWHTAASFVRNPSTLRADWNRITPAIDWLASDRAQESTRRGLLKELALACLPAKEKTSSQQDPTVLVRDVSRLLSPPNREQFLLEIAAGASEHIRAWQQLVPYIHIAFHSKVMFTAEAEQALWNKRYLDTLFPRNDWKTFGKISEDAKRWPKPFQADWQRYLDQRRAAAPPRPDPFRQPVPYVRSVGTLMKQTATSTWVSAKKHSIPILAAAVALLLVSLLLLYIAQAGAQVTLTVAAQNYAQPMTLTAHTNGPAGTLPAQEIIRGFYKTGTGHATGTLPVGTAKAQTSVCFSNDGNAPVEIPTNTTISTADGIQFVTTASGRYPAKTDCGDASNPIQIPVQAVEPGKHENVAASTINTIPDDSLAAIAKDNQVDAKSLHLTVTNFNAASGGKAKMAPAITAQDLDKVKASLSDQLQTEITGWVKQQGKEGTVGKTTIKTTLINTPAEDTTIDSGDTFPAEVDAQVSILLVRNADLQKAALSQLKSALGKDKDYSSYVIADNVKTPVIITKLQTQSSDAQSVKLRFSASTVIMPPISKENIQNEIVGHTPSEAQQTIMRDSSAVKKAAIQVQPGFFPWLIPPWPGRVHVTLLPDLGVSDLQDSAQK